MTLYQSGTLKASGRTIATYEQPFNVDVIHIKDEREALTGNSFLLDSENLTQITNNNISSLNGELIFNGSSSWGSIISPIPIGLQDFTMEASCRFLSTNLGSNGNGTFCFGTTPYFYWGIWLTNSNTIINTQFTLIGYGDIRVSAPFSIGQKYRFIATRKQGMLYLLINKSLKTSVSFVHSMPSISRIGTHNPVDYSLNANLEYLAISRFAKYTESFSDIYRSIAWR